MSMHEEIPQPALVVVVVGDRAGPPPGPIDLPNAERFHFHAFHEINRCLLSRLCPDVVLSALMGPGFDAIELAALLEELGFSGRYRALVASLPDAGLVRREVRAAAPGVDFDVLATSRVLDV